MASFALSIVGSAIGGPVGGAIGSMVGGLIDNALFPTPKPMPPQITSSTFGQAMPIAWGPMVPLPGNMIWTSGWRNASSGGNKGLQIALGKAAGKSSGPPQQIADCAFAFADSRRRGGAFEVSWLRKLYANGNLIFDADRASVEPTPDAYGAVTWPHDGGTHKDFDTLTVYPGNAIAIPDPTIEAMTGVGLTPAYRGTPYIVVRSLQGTPFGNAVPTLRAICRADTTVRIQQIVDHICDASGIDSGGMVSSGRLTQTLDGYAITGQTDGVSAIQPLALVYNFDAAEVAGELRFQPRGDPPLVLIEYRMLAAHAYGDTQPDAFDWPRERVGLLPRTAALTFNDPAMDLNTNTQYATRETGSLQSNISTSVGLTMTADVGRKVADRLLWEPWTGRQGFEKGATDDRLFFLEAGRTYSMETPESFGPEVVRLTTRTRGINGVIEFTAKRDASAIYVSTAPSADANALSNELGLGGPVNPPAFIEPPSTLPGLPAQTSGQALLLIGLSGGDGTTANDSWGGCDVYRATSDVTEDYVYIGTQIGVTCMGKLTVALAGAGGGNPDSTHILHVSTLESGGEPLPSSALDASVAQIPYFVDGEYMTAEDVVSVGGDVYELSLLWRGLYGTSKGSHAIGTAFVRLDSSAFTTSLPAGYVQGSPLYFRFVSAGEQLSNVTSYAYTPGGTGYGGGTHGVPITPAAPTVTPTPAGNAVTIPAAPASDNVQTATVLRAPGLGASIGSAAEIGSAPAGGTFIDATAAAGDPYTYFVVFNNVVGPSAGSTGAGATTAASANLWGFGWNMPIAAITPSVAFAYSIKGEPWTLPAGLPDCHCDIKGGVGPSSTTVFDLQVDGVSHGSMTFTASATSATFTWSADVALLSTDQASVVPPADLHGMSGLLVGGLFGPRG